MAEKTKRTQKQQKKLVEKMLKKGITWRERSTIQKSIPFMEIYDDGIVNLGNNSYSMTFSFSDINYSGTDDIKRIDIFQKYGDFINSFDEEAHLQLTLQNKPLHEYHDDLLLPITDSDRKRVVNVLVKEDIIDEKTKEKHTVKRVQQCSFSQLKSEYNEIQNNRIYGANRFIAERFLTIKIKADDYESAKKWFERTKGDAFKILHKLGSKVVPLDKLDKLKQLREYYRPQGKRQLNYPYIVSLGVGDKDIIAPYAYDTTSDYYIRFGEEHLTQTLFVSELPSDISDTTVSRLLDIDEPVTLTMNIHPQDYRKAKDEVEKKLNHQEQQKFNELDRQARNSVPYPQASRKVTKDIEATERFLDDIEDRNEKMFLCNILIHVRGNTKEDIEFIVQGMRKKAADIDIIPMSIQQEDAFNSCIPLGRDDLEIKRTFTTSSVSAFIPFRVTEITDTNGLTYGKNTESKNIIKLDRKRLFNGGGFYLGIPGSGKSMGAKNEIWECHHRNPYDDMLIIDPEDEYGYLIRALGGQVIDLSTSSGLHLNPFDINQNYGGEDEPDPIPFKSDFIVSLIEVTLSPKNGIDAISRSVIDRCVREVYKAYINMPIAENIPTFADFYRILKQQPEQEAINLASGLETYVTGSLNMFSHPTNIKLENRLISFNTKNLAKHLRVMAMTIIQDFIWNRLSFNQSKNRSTWLWNDEVHLSLRVKELCDWLVEMWKRGRKYGLLPTGITQEIEDCFRYDSAKSLIAASEFVMMCKQSQTGLDILAEQMQLTSHHLSELLTADKGVGYMKAGTEIIPFNNNYENEKAFFFQLISTKPGA